MRTRKWFQRTYHYHVDPDEILLDAQNLAGFNQQQFEGVIERSISKRAFTFLAIACGIVMLVFIIKLSRLQVAQGQTYFAQSEANRLDEVTLFSRRGIIYDRNKKELAWNTPGDNDEPFSYRSYIDSPGFAHMLGYVRYPKKDTSGFFWRLSLEGVEGVELQYDEQLRGQHGSKLIETDVRQNVISEGHVQSPVDGENITLTIDAVVQSALARGMNEMIEQFDYTAGAGLVIDVTTGDLLAMVSLPEFNSEVLSLGQDKEIIESYFQQSDKPSLDRALLGLYTPGSIVKPFIALGMLQEGIITPESTVTSTGTLEIPNPWSPDNPTIFRDWRPKGHGTTDIYHAIADSVNTFFYVYGGGYKNTSGLGISGIHEYLKKFGIAQSFTFDLGRTPAGVIPNPEWKKKTYQDGTWRIGDTYNTVIGQFGTQVTPLQMLRAVSAIANRGYLVTPRLDLNDRVDRKNIVGIDDQNFTVIHDAMRQTVVKGTAQTLNLSAVHVAAKTGTAQTKGNTRVNAWSIGFFPYENPRYAFTVVMEEGPSQDNVGASYAVRKMLDVMAEESPQYFVH